MKNQESPAFRRGEEVKYRGECPQCSEAAGYPIASTFPDKPGAQKWVRRHRGITGHQPTITEPNGECAS